MNRKLTFRALLAISVAGIIGCTTIRPHESFSDVRDAVADRGIPRVEWRGITADDTAVDQAVAAMLRSELNIDQAVQIALLNNRDLQAMYEELGIAQADLVQAGLLRNPVFDFTIRWPNESPRTANLELSVVHNFLDVFFIPARKQIAEAQYRAVTLRVAGEVIDLAAEVQRAFYQLQSAQQMLEMFDLVTTATDAAAETARRLRAAGNMTQRELLEHESLAAEAQLERLSSAAMVTLAREHLARVMGVAGSDEPWTVPTRLPNLSEAEPTGNALESRAILQRFDVQAARHEVQALARSARVAGATSYLSDIEIGVDAERESPEGTRLVGPTISAPIPLFDQGQASLASARASFRQSGQRYQATKNRARSEVRVALAELTLARARVQQLQRVVLPLRAGAVEQAQLEYNGMLIGVFELLETKRQQVEAGRDYIEALRDYWMARTELERALGGKLPEAGEGAEPLPPRTPATAPAPATAPQGHQHHHH